MDFVARFNRDLRPTCISGSVDPAIERVVEEKVRRVLETGNPEAIEHVLGRRVLEIRVYPERDGAVLAITRDITAWKTTAQRLEHMAEATPHFTWIAGPDGTIRFINKQWMDYTGLSLEETNELEAVSRAIHPDDAARVFPMWAEALRTGKPHEVQWRFKRRRDGVYRWFLTRAVAVKNERGEIEEWLGTATDIDDQKQLESRKDDFIAMLAHELRNPLGPIVNAAHLIESDSKDQGARRLAAVVSRQSKHMAKLVDDLLDVSRISRGKIEIAPRATNLVELVRSVVDDYRQGFAAKAIALGVDAPAREIRVSVDRTRIAQCIGNLLHNAAKFSDAGGAVRVEITSTDVEARVSVIDEGVGIEPALLPSVFESFVQGPQALDRRQGGLGLGLALVKGLVELHGGRVHATSAGLERGACFTITLPLVEVESSAEVEQERAVRARRARVLVIEDHADAREMLEMLLVRIGHEVKAAADGAEGVRVAEAFRPTVVLCDIGLPGKMDGYDVCKALLRSDPSVKAIALTGYGQAADRARAIEAGFAVHVTKPVEPEALMRLIAKLTVS